MKLKNCSWEHLCVWEIDAFKKWRKGTKKAIFFIKKFQHQYFCEGCLGLLFGIYPKIKVKPLTKRARNILVLLRLEKNAELG